MAFKFPLENQDLYKGSISFRRVITNTPSLTKIAKDFSSVVDTQGLPAMSEGRNLTNSERLSISSSDIAPASSIASGSQDIQTNIGCTLYLPPSITFADTVEYDRFDFGAIGAIAERGVQNGNNLLPSIYKGLSQAGSSFVKLTEGLGDDIGARLAAVRLSQSLGGDTVAAVARSGFRVTTNPNTKTLFKSVALRTLQLSFKLIASSPAEAREIVAIENYFREELYPDTINFDPGGSNIPIGYQFPNKIQVKLSYNGKRVGHKFLPMYLQGVNAVYNPSAMGYHVDGMPSEMDLSLEFLEPRGLTKDDIRKGY